MRIHKDEYFLRAAELVASRSTCLRRAVGCVLTNARGHQLSTGHNGRPSGWPHCNEVSTFVWSVRKTEPEKKFPVSEEFPNACHGAFRSDGKRWPSGHNLDACEAIHAEQNALLQCRDAYAIDTCYVTVSPCITCVKLLLNTSCRRIIFRSAYAHDDAARKLWQSGFSTSSKDQEPREWTRWGTAPG